MIREDELKSNLDYSEGQKGGSTACIDRTDQSV